MQEHPREGSSEHPCGPGLVSTLVSAGSLKAEPETETKGQTVNLKMVSTYFRMLGFLTAMQSLLNYSF